MYAKEITKDEINELELFHFDGDIVLIDDPKTLDQCMFEMENENMVGLDTETKPAFKKGVHHNISLVQIATSEKVFLIRINKTGFPQRLLNFLNKEIPVKIGIGLDDDIQRLAVFGEINPETFIDLNVYCKNIGFKNVGARNLTALILNKRISKNQQTSNWEADQLSEAQIRYAATDAWICREIYLRLLENGL